MRVCLVMQERMSWRDSVMSLAAPIRPPSPAAGQSLSSRLS